MACLFVNAGSKDAYACTYRIWCRQWAIYNDSICLRSRYYVRYLGVKLSELLFSNLLEHDHGRLLFLAHREARSPCFLVLRRISPRVVYEHRPVGLCCRSCQ